MPVYRIVNWTSTGYRCLNVPGNAANETTVDIAGCDWGGVNTANQLWIVGSPAQTNNTIDSNGQFIYSGAPQVLSPALQTQTSADHGLQHSVIMNVASLVAHGYDANQTPVLSASVDNIQGRNSRLKLAPSTAVSTASFNSTWNIVPSPSFNAATTPQNPCAGVRGYGALVCGGDFYAYFSWVNSL